MRLGRLHVRSQLASGFGATVFLLVAFEVRQLAQRSAAAAKEIKALVLDAVEQVQAAADATDALGQEAVALLQMVGKFRLSDDERRAGIDLAQAPVGGALLLAA